MSQRASQSLVAALIRIGLLLALAILLMAENAQAQTQVPTQSAQPAIHNGTQAENTHPTQWTQRLVR